MRFPRNPLKLHLAVLGNLGPGCLLQLGQASNVQHGNGWIEALHRGTCEAVDRDLKGLGFQSVGPLQARNWPGWALRGYTHPREDTWAVHYLGMLFGSELAFVTEFTDGTWLTTATNCMAPSPTMRDASGRVEDIFASHLAHADGPRVPVGGQRELADSMRRFFKWKD
jgi:hypothetical protein